jgi:hypothetical protein
MSLRVFAQARNLDDISASKFKIPIYALRMQSYPGAHISPSLRQLSSEGYNNLV